MEYCHSNEIRHILISGDNPASPDPAAEHGPGQVMSKISWPMASQDFRFVLFSSVAGT